MWRMKYQYMHICVIDIAAVLISSLHRADSCRSVYILAVYVAAQWHAHGTCACADAGRVLLCHRKTGCAGNHAHHCRCTSHAAVTQQATEPDRWLAKATRNLKSSTTHTPLQQVPEAVHHNHPHAQAADDPTATALGTRPAAHRPYSKNLLRCSRPSPNHPPHQQTLSTAMQRYIAGSELKCKGPWRQGWCQGHQPHTPTCPSQQCWTASMQASNNSTLKKPSRASKRRQQGERAPGSEPQRPPILKICIAEHVAYPACWRYLPALPQLPFDLPPASQIVKQCPNHNTACSCIPRMYGQSQSAGDCGIHGRQNTMLHARARNTAANSLCARRLPPSALTPLTSVQASESTAQPNPLTYSTGHSPTCQGGGVNTSRCIQYVFSWIPVVSPTCWCFEAAPTTHQHRTKRTWEPQSQGFSPHPAHRCRRASAATTTSSDQTSHSAAHWLAGTTAALHAVPATLHKPYWAAGAHTHAHGHQPITGGGGGSVPRRTAAIPT